MNFTRDSDRDASILVRFATRICSRCSASARLVKNKKKNVFGEAGDKFQLSVKFYNLKYDIFSICSYVTLNSQTSIRKTIMFFIFNLRVCPNQFANKKVIGKFKDEASGVVLTEFVRLRSKMHSSYIKDNGGSASRAAKGIKKKRYQKEYQT